MRTLLKCVLLLGIGLVLLSGCAITHKFGPYHGKVMDKETGEPIKGAVVFMRFFTEFAFSPGGGVSEYADALEVLTDSNGEYSIPSHRVITFHVGSLWDDKVQAIIYKPGYRAYNGYLLANENEIYKLSKLKTSQEIKDNWSNLFYSSDEVPCEKQRVIMKYHNYERINLGLRALKFGRCGDKYE